MKIVVLSVPDCPNVALLDERLEMLLIDRDDVRVVHQLVADEQSARRWGMHGSPTLLIDGIDPFANPDTFASVSCRLYHDEGGLQGAPSLGALRKALKASES